MKQLFYFLFAALILTGCNPDDDDVTNTTPTVDYKYVWKYDSQMTYFYGFNSSYKVYLGTIEVPLANDGAYNSATEMLDYINQALAGQKKLVLGTDGYIYGEADQDYGDIRCIYQSWQVQWQINMDTVP